MKRAGWVLAIVAGCGGGAVPIDGGGLDASSVDGGSVDAVAPGADAGPAADAFVPPSSACAAFPASTGTIVHVDPSMASALPQMTYDAAPNTTFVLADGTYHTTGD